MPDSLGFPRRLYQEVLEHCLRSLPDEGCGLIAVTGDKVVAVYPTGNDDPSPHSFTVPPGEHYRALVDAESRGWEIGGAFHSHPSGGPRPSPTDLDLALEPGWVYVIVAPGEVPQARAWSIRSGEPVEVEIRIA